MSKTYQGEGNVIKVTLVAAQVSGVPMVIGKLLGIPLTDGAIGDVIAVAISGIYNVLAVTGAAFVKGETITWDVSAALADDQAATPAAGDLTLGCVAVEDVASAAAGSTVAVKLNVGPNTVT